MRIMEDWRRLRETERVRHGEMRLGMMERNVLALSHYEDETETNEGSALWSIYRLALAYGHSVLVYGPPGTGKTTSAMEHELGARLAYRHQCKPSDTAEDVLGRVGIRDGSTVFERGAGAVAVEQGHRFIFDEVDRASEDVLALLYSMGDGKPFVLADGSVITPHESLQVILTTNIDPWEMFPPDSGIRDRFPFLRIPEPSPEALASLPPWVRDTARRAVRSGVSGLRAWFHFSDLLSVTGYAMEDVLADLSEDGSHIATDGNGLALPSIVLREQTIRRVAASVFGNDGAEIVRAFRVAACRAKDAPVPAPKRSICDRLVIEAYERGRSHGLAEGLAEHEHEHDSGTCSECEAIYEAGEESGREYEREYAEHEHLHSSECSECDSMWQAGLEACECEHEHSARYCGECGELRTEAREEMREEMLDSLVHIARTVLGNESDADALVEMLGEECEA